VTVTGVTLAAGSHVLRLTMNSGDFNVNYVDVAKAVVSGISLPGRVQAEDYKAGGEGVGYHDLTAGNTGGQYKTDNVDIEATTDAGGGFNVGWIQAGEWTAYDVSVATARTYTITARLASAVAGTKNMTLLVDGGSVATFAFSDAAGNHVIRLNYNSSDFNVNYVDVK
jgi:hypothetical protein